MAKMRWDLEGDRKKLQRGYISIKEEEKSMPDQYRIKGAFFENLKGGGPAFTGFVEIDGVKTQIALWPKTSQAGQNYLQVSEDKKKPMQPGAAPPRSGAFAPRKPAPPRPFGDDGDDIPF